MKRNTWTEATYSVIGNRLYASGSYIVPNLFLCGHQLANHWRIPSRHNANGAYTREFQVHVHVPWKFEIISNTVIAANGKLAQIQIAFVSWLSLVHSQLIYTFPFSSRVLVSRRREIFAIHRSRYSLSKRHAGNFEKIAVLIADAFCLCPYW